ncbi:MAG: ABC transporter permease [Magnetococcales bacterium]|nr:ABC transporter permease [Magnetococcales bacterium]MBF0151171.1 ABC transporter permease [Magnetococcales bacterium]MBF0174629.1 ABC transporter permease [Magnetococcales bacterium]MBF0632653.1 ABC transporter permease [Magnetococcales bacterium]
MFIFLAQTLRAVPTPPWRWHNLLKQIHFIGMRSMFVIALTSIFAGMVLALQGFYTLSRFGSEALLGPAVALSMIRELGPVLSGLMITGRAGSAVAAELGIMRIREQIDALEVMGVPPIHFLAVPRFLAGLIVLPLLTVIFDVIGIFGGYLVAVQLLGLSAGTYFGGIESAVSMHDIHTGLIKAFCFGMIITWVCSFKGFFAKRGAEGVSHATTSAVVLASVLILVSDYFITAIML